MTRRWRGMVVVYALLLVHLRRVGGHREERMRALMAGLILLVLTGCGTGGMSQQYITRNDRGQEILTGPCGGRTLEGCQSVTITNNPADEEFWQFEARVKVRALVGIPYGRMPQDYNVIGPRRLCEAVRATVKPDIPTEPCKGPFYFRRDANQ